MEPDIDDLVLLVRPGVGPRPGIDWQHNTAPADHNGLNEGWGTFGTGGECVGGFRLSPVDDLGERAGRTLVRVVPRSLSSRRTEERGFHFWRRCGLQVKQGDPQFKLCLEPSCSGQWSVVRVRRPPSACHLPLLGPVDEFPVY